MGIYRAEIGVREATRGPQAVGARLGDLWPFFYHGMLVPCHDTMPSFMIFRRVLDLQELKNQVSKSSRPSHDAQMFDFHSHFVHGT